MKKLHSECLKKEKILLGLWQFLSIVGTVATFLVVFVLINKGKPYQERWALLPLVATISAAAVAIEFAVIHAFGLVLKDDAAAKTSVVTALVALASLAILSGVATISTGTTRVIITILTGVALMLFVPGGVYVFGKRLPEMLAVTEKKMFKHIFNQMGATLFAISTIIVLV